MKLSVIPAETSGKVHSAHCALREQSEPGQRRGLLLATTSFIVAWSRSPKRFERPPWAAHSTGRIGYTNERAAQYVNEQAAADPRPAQPVPPAEPAQAAHHEDRPRQVRECVALPPARRQSGSTEELSSTSATTHRPNGRKTPTSSTRSSTNASSSRRYSSDAPKNSSANNPGTKAAIARTSSRTPSPNSRTSSSSTVSANCSTSKHSGTDKASRPPSNNNSS